jgi:hypothetical protein
MTYLRGGSKWEIHHHLFRIGKNYMRQQWNSKRLKVGIGCGIHVREREERPYYPYVFLWADHHSYFILNSHVAMPSKYRSEFPEQFLNLMEDLKFLPKEILITKEEMTKLLEPITSRLGINLKLVKKLVAIEKAKHSMFDFFACD